MGPYTVDTGNEESKKIIVQIWPINYLEGHSHISKSRQKKTKQEYHIGF